jgi:TPR repeat protein
MKRLIFCLTLVVVVFALSYASAMENPDMIIKKGIEATGLSVWAQSGKIQYSSSGNSAFAFLKKVKKVASGRSTIDRSVDIHITLHKLVSSAAQTYETEVASIKQDRTTYAIINESSGERTRVLFIQKKMSRFLRPNYRSYGYAGNFFLEVELNLGCDKDQIVMDEQTGGQIVLKLTENILKLIKPPHKKKVKQHKRWNPTKEECARMRQDLIDHGNSNMEDGYVGVAIAAMGDIELHFCGGGVIPLRKGTKIRIGDCIKTGPNGRVRVQMADRDEKHKCGPSVINVATNGEMCFAKFLASFDDPPKQNSAIELLKGTIRMFFKGWGRHSSVSVKTGVTVCGIRGSEVIISYDPEKERVLAYVLHGLMDVTNTRTGATKSLKKNQKLVVSKGVIGKVEPLSRKEWDSLVKENGLEIGARQPAGKEDILKEAIGYFTGTGGSVDFEKARGLFMEASQQENPLAKMWVARCYYMGIGGFRGNVALGKQMAKESFGHVLKAAQNGDPDAMFLVASAYEQGHSIPQDYTKAVSWYQKAADKGNALAMHHLGYMCQHGLGTPQDYQKAIILYHEAADKGVAYAMHSIGIMHRNGNGVEKNAKHAISWFQKACSIGLPYSCAGLGYTYEKGLGVNKDLGLAAGYYKKGCERGNAVACSSLAIMYAEGRGVKQDYGRAVYYLKNGCDGGNTVSCGNLGWMIYHGYGTKADRKGGRELMERACEKGYKSSCERLKKLSE